MTSYCCGDGVCEGPENSCNCEVDCGPHPLNETGLCGDGVDNDCDGPADCNDSDCATDPLCQAPPCLAKNESCMNNEDCCSGTCRRGRCR
jgi:hypothetical protein